MIDDFLRLLFAEKPVRRSRSGDPLPLPPWRSSILGQPAASEKAAATENAPDDDEDDEDDVDDDEDDDVEKEEE